MPLHYSPQYPYPNLVYSRVCVFMATMGYSIDKIASGLGNASAFAANFIEQGGGPDGVYP